MTQGIEIPYVRDARQVEVSSAGTPVRKFKGLKKNTEFKPGEPGRGARIELGYTDLEVLKVAEGATYDLPILILSFNYKTNARGRIDDRGNWGKYLKSCEELGFPDEAVLDNKRVTMEAVVETIPARPGNPEAVPPIPSTPASTYISWRLVEVEGGAQASKDTVDPVQEALSLLHSKTSAEFSQLALQNQVLRTVQSAVFDGSLLAGIVAAGLAVLDGERYWVIGRPR